MQARVEITMGDATPHRAVSMCAHDLAGILERRAGPVELCEVRIDEPETDAMLVRVQLCITSHPLELRLTLLHDADVYIALARSFDRATDLLIELRKCSPVGLLHKWSARAAGRRKSPEPYPSRTLPAHPPGEGPLPAS